MKWSPGWHGGEEFQFEKKPGELVTDGELHATAQSRGSRSRTLRTVRCCNVLSRRIHGRHRAVQQMLRFECFQNEWRTAPLLVAALACSEP